MDVSAKVPCAAVLDTEDHLSVARSMAALQLLSLQTQDAAGVVEGAECGAAMDTTCQSNAAPSAGAADSDWLAYEWAARLIHCCTTGGSLMARDGVVMVGNHRD